MVTLTPRLGKWMMAILVVSVGANLFLGGVLAGRWLAPRPMTLAAGPPVGGAPDRPLRGPIERMAQSLPAEQRAEFDRALGHRRREATEAGRALQDARAKVREALIAERFDRTALDQALIDLRAQNERLQKSVHDGIADAAQHLPVEARRRLYESQRPPRGEREPGREREGR
jgi:uncharacterized membrane protein